MTHDRNLAVKFLRSGKVKDVYDAGDGMLLFRFSDRVSAYDVQFTDSIPRKGEVLCKFAQFWFERLPVRSHFEGRISDTDILVKRMDMIPVECVVRGYLYGSAVERFRRGRLALPPGTRDALASRLPRPVFDPTTKSKRDVPVDRDGAVRLGLLDGRTYDELERTSLSLYGAMSGVADAAGFILADLKLEFGMVDGRPCLGDSIGPDEYRLWPKDGYAEGRTQVSYDKQILRDWLAGAGWARRFEDARAAGEDPRPPAIPDKIRDDMTARYVESYERITGRSM